MGLHSVAWVPPSGPSNWMHWPAHVLGIAVGSHFAPVGSPGFGMSTHTPASWSHLRPVGHCESLPHEGRQPSRVPSWSIGKQTRSSRSLHLLSMENGSLTDVSCGPMVQPSTQTPVLPVLPMRQSLLAPGQSLVEVQVLEQ